MGVTYIVLAPEHPLTTEIASPERLEVCYFIDYVVVYMFLVHGLFLCYDLISVTNECDGESRVAPDELWGSMWRWFSL